MVSLEEPSRPLQIPCWHAATPAAWSFSKAAAKEIHRQRAAAGITPAAGSAVSWNLESRRSPWMATPEPATGMAVAPPAGGRPVVLSQPSPMRAAAWIGNLHALNFHEGAPSVLTTPAELSAVHCHKRQNALAGRPAGACNRTSTDLSLPRFAGCSFLVPSGLGSTAGLSVSRARRSPRDGTRCGAGLQNEPEPTRDGRQWRLRRRWTRARHALDDDSGLGPPYPQPSSRGADSRATPGSGRERHGNCARRRPLRTPAGSGAARTSRLAWHGWRHALVLELPAVLAGGARSPSGLPAGAQPTTPSRHQFGALTLIRLFGFPIRCR